MNALAAALLLMLAPASQAKETAGVKTQKQLDALQQDIGRPQDFENFVEGSLSRPTLQEEALAAVPSRAGSASFRPISLSPSGRNLFPDAAAKPPVPIEGLAGRRRPAKPSDDPLQGPVALLGLTGALLIAASFYQRPPRSAPDSAIVPPPNFFRDPEAFAPKSAPAAAPPLAEAPEPPPIFVDTRMPAPTWRAITLREQQLIENWNSSREKALGQASLEEWLDARAAAAGIDAELLKSKLSRSV